MVLSEGYNWGQQSTVSVLQFAQVAYIYNYFSDYEIQMSESIRKDDALRAIQDGILPVWFNRLTCDQAFNENPNGMSFPAFAGIFYSVRLFASQTETLFLSKDNYTALIGSDLIPQRLKDYVAKTYTSTQDEIEASSKRVFQHVEEKHYFNQYNNIIFLQKKKKTHLKAVSALRKTTEVELDELLGNLEFPADSPSIIFNMYDNYRNASIHLSDWIRFVKTSFTYMSLTPNGVQRFNYDQIAKKNDYLDGDYNCFAFGQTESKYQTLLYDWLTENVGYSVNMKEYLAWFRLPFGFEYLRQPGLPWRTSVKRVNPLCQLISRPPKPSEIWDSGSPNTTDKWLSQATTCRSEKETTSISRLSRSHSRRTVQLIGTNSIRAPSTPTLISKPEPKILPNEMHLP